MIGYTLRVAVTTAYLTLIATDGDTATSLAGPYALLVLIVAVHDLIRERGRTNVGTPTH